MKTVIKIAADARRPYARGLGFQVQHLAENPGLPEKPAIPPRTLAANGLSEIGNHAHAKATVGSNFLMAADNPGGALQVIVPQTIQPKVRRAIGRLFPKKRRTQ